MSKNQYSWLDKHIKAQKVNTDVINKIMRGNHVDEYTERDEVRDARRRR